MSSASASESDSKHCPQCQAPLPEDAPQGLCPKCLLAGASIRTETGEATPHRTAPDLAQLATAFPQLDVLELIGCGGMGFVFKARQPKLDRFVALKILPQSLASDPAFAERFSREGRVLAKLNHPNIVTIHDFGQANGFFYLLMEFVDGVNLRQAMQVGRFTPAQALAIVPKICDALQFAHTEGILHRDIKPENILLDSKGRVKIADFGIAKLLERGSTSRGVSSGPAAPESSQAPVAGSACSERTPAPQALTDAGKALGTPTYMAPEQRACIADVDQRADIYSLGVVFYEMLTGELPLGRFAPPSEKSAADPRLDEVVLRALEKERERRQFSAGEVKTQVETIATELGREGTPAPTSTERGKSQLVRIVEILSGTVFTSTLAVRLVNLSALGFLGFLAFLGFAPWPGMQRCFGFSGFFGMFGLIGFAFLVEYRKRRAASGRSAREAVGFTSTEDDATHGAPTEEFASSEAKRGARLCQRPAAAPWQARVGWGLLRLVLRTQPRSGAFEKHPESMVAQNRRFWIIVGFALLVLCGVGALIYGTDLIWRSRAMDCVLETLPGEVQLQNGDRLDTGFRFRMPADHVMIFEMLHHSPNAASDTVDSLSVYLAGGDGKRMMTVRWTVRDGNMLMPDAHDLERWVVHSQIFDPDGVSSVTAPPVWTQKVNGRVWSVLKSDSVRLRIGQSAIFPISQMQGENEYELRVTHQALPAGLSRKGNVSVNSGTNWHELAPASVARMPPHDAAFGPVIEQVNKDGAAWSLFREYTVKRTLAELARTYPVDAPEIAHARLAMELIGSDPTAAVNRYTVDIPRLPPGALKVTLSEADRAWVQENKPLKVVIYRDELAAVIVPLQTNGLLHTAIWGRHLGEWKTRSGADLPDAWTLAEAETVFRERAAELYDQFRRLPDQQPSLAEAASGQLTTNLTELVGAMMNSMTQIVSRVPGLNTALLNAGQQMSAQIQNAAAANTASKTPSGRAVETIDIAADGTLTVAGAACPMEQLQERISTLAAHQPYSSHVEIRADSRAPFNQVAAVVQACQSAGLGYALVRSSQQ